MKAIKWLQTHFLPIAVVFASFLVFLLFRDKSLTLDEVSTINIAKDWYPMLQMMWHDEGNMWLYYVLIHFWLKLGTTMGVLRSLSAIFAILTVPVMYLLAREVAGTKVARLATGLFLINTYFIFYAQEGRSYSLALLLATCSSYTFLKFMKDPSSKKYLALYVLSSVLSIYTYLLTGLVIAAQYMSALVLPKRIPWKSMILAAIAIAVCIIPLVLAPSFRGGHQLDWLQRPKAIYLPMGFILLGGDSLIVTVLYGLVIMGYLLQSRREFLQKSWDRFYILWLAVWTVFPIVFGFVFSLVAKPIYEPESFNSVLPGFIIIAAIALENLRTSHKWLSRVALGLIILFSVIRLGGWYAESLSMHIVLDNEEPRDWKEVVEYIEDHRKPHDAVILYAYYIRPPFEYYLNDYPASKRPTIIEISSATYALGGGTKLPEPNVQELATMSTQYERVWLISSYNDTYWLGRKNQWLEVESVLHRNFQVKEDTRLFEVRIQLFQSNNYRNVK